MTRTKQVARKTRQGVVPPVESSRQANIRRREKKKAKIKDRIRRRDEKKLKQYTDTYGEVEGKERFKKRNPVSSKRLTKTELEERGKEEEKRKHLRTAGNERAQQQGQVDDGSTETHQVKSNAAPHQPIVDMEELANAAMKALSLTKTEQEQEQLAQAGESGNGDKTTDTGTEGSETMDQLQVDLDDLAKAMRKVRIRTGRERKNKAKAMRKVRITTGRERKDKAKARRKVRIRTGRERKDKAKSDAMEAKCREPMRLRSGRCF